MQHFIGVLFLSIFIAFVFGSSDEIKRLPGLKFPLNFKQYSGYLQVSETHFLHYWFVESQNDPTNDPLIFWFNGGPGCSSLEGIIHEMGPFQVNPDGKTLRKNPNAWNKFASVVYIESPAGVGFSYSTDRNMTTGDDLVAQENYEAIKQFFQRYPNLQNLSTFIIGESYGGIYIPTLTVKIIENQNNFKINLGGMAIGNGLLSDLINKETSTKFAYYHGFIEESIWDNFEKKCCNGCVDTCDFGNLTDECYGPVGDSFLGVNPYDIYGKCEYGEEVTLQNLTLSKSFYMQSHSSKKSIKDDKNMIMCINSTDITTYLNLPSVRKALHIPQNLPKWTICYSGNGSYHSQYNDMKPFFKKVLNANVPILLYYGDTDLLCNFMMGQKFSAQLGLPIIEHENPYLQRRDISDLTCFLPEIYAHYLKLRCSVILPEMSRRCKYGKAWQVNGQTAGFKTVYQGLTFTTIRGAGHMAPQLKPAETAHAIKQFVSKQSL